MAEPIIELAKALKEELEAALEVDVERRYSPYLQADELREPRWLMALASEELAGQKRNIADCDLAIDIALQLAHPDRASQEGDDIDAEWCDERIEDLGQLKSLYRPGGVLRNKRIANCDFQRYENIPLYRPDLLLENRIFTGVVRLIYRFEHSTELDEE